MRKRKWLAGVAMVPVILLVACSSSPPISYYSLDQGASLPPASGVVPSVFIAQASIPDRLNRPQMVSRNGYEVHVSDQNRWAEPLKQAIPRVLADELGWLLNSSQVSAGAGLKQPDFQVFLDVQRFDAVSGRSVEVDVLWRVESSKGVKPGRSSFVVSTAGSDIPAVVAAQRRALTMLAADIAAEIRQQAPAVQPASVGTGQKSLK